MEEAHRTGYVDVGRCGAPMLSEHAPLLESPLFMHPKALQTLSFWGFMEAVSHRHN